MEIQTINKEKLNTDKLESFLIDEIKRALNYEFNEKTDSDEIKNNFSQNIGKAIADGIDEWIKEAIKLVEIYTSDTQSEVNDIQMFANDIGEAVDNLITYVNILFEHDVIDSLEIENVERYINIIMWKEKLCLFFDRKSY